MKSKKISLMLLAVIMVLPVFAFATPVGAIEIENGIIGLVDFGDTRSLPGCGWVYEGSSRVCGEVPFVSYGTYSPVGLGAGTVTQFYPATGNPNTWYHATIVLDLDGDSSDDIEVTRSIMVPSGQKYFLVKYTIENIKGSALANFRFFQGVDYDFYMEASYAADFVSAYDSGWDGTYVGFAGDISSDHHSVDSCTNNWIALSTGTLNDASYYYGDVGVGLEWDFGSLGTGESVDLTVKFAFADSESELEGILILDEYIPEFPTSAIPVASILGLLFFFNYRKRRKAQQTK